MNENLKIVNFYHLLNCSFNIPEFQRGYRWEKKQVEDLLNDIKDFIDKRSKGLIKEKEFYCLQTIVVYKISDKHYDVIDGQQRLTTLYLILQALKNVIEENCDTQTIYKIGYSKYKNDSKDYLNCNGFLNDDNNEHELTADNFFIHQAYVEICEWFNNNKRYRVLFAQMLMNNDINSNLPDEDKKDLRVVWYETISREKDSYDKIQLEKDSIEIFNRLNYGKIKLTDTELIKALILQSDCYGDKQAIMEQWTSKVATDWDNMEKKLHNPYFWSMLNAKEDASNPSHIGFILSFVAKDIYEENDKQFKKVRKDSHFDYVVIEKWLSLPENNREKTVKDLWDRVINVFSLFESWYEDLKIYHSIGLLVLFENNRDKIITLIRELYNQKSLSKSAFTEILRNRIESHVRITSKDDDKNINTLSTINYIDNRDEIIKVLELVNVIDHLRKPNDESRFPFHLFKKYNVTSLEHIHPQNIVDMSFEDACSWLERKSEELEKLEGLDDKNKNNVLEAKEAANKLKSVLVFLDEKIEDKTKREANKKANREAAKNYERKLSETQDLIKIVDKAFNELAGMDETIMHSISNLALVDQPTNSALRNNLLDTKRKKLKERCEAPNSSQEHTFVPITTQLVFNKAFSDSVNELKFWSRPDREAYFNHIQSIYNEFVK